MQDEPFLTKPQKEITEEDWADAAHFISSVSDDRESRFDAMSKAEIKRDRLVARGLM